MNHSKFWTPVWICFAVVAIGASAKSTRAAIAFDGQLTNTSQIRTASNNPFFGAGNTQNLAGVNFFYNPGGVSGDVAAGGSVSGLFFNDINLAGNTVPPGPYALTANGGAASLLLNFPWSQTNEDNARFQTPNIIGPDATTANAVAREMFYVSTTTVAPFNHLTATTTFSGLGANRNVFIQVIGGDQGSPFPWDGDILVKSNAATIGTWLTVADSNLNTASLFAFNTTTNALGELALNFQAANGNHAGISAILISGEGVAQAAVPEPTSFALWSVGAIGLLALRRYRRG